MAAESDGVMDYGSGRYKIVGGVKYEVKRILTRQG